VIGKPDEAERPMRRLPSIGLRDLPQRERQHDVGFHRAPGQQGVFLEHEGDFVPFAGLVRTFPENLEMSAGRLLESRDHFEDGGFPAAGRPHEANEFARARLEIHALDGNRAVGVHLFQLLHAHQRGRLFRQHPLTTRVM
jgi:hypothetical protein